MKRPLVSCLPTIILLLAGCMAAQETTISVSQSGIESASQPALSADEVAHGKNIYTIHCASCHGKNLEGEANWKQQNEDGSFRSPPHSADGHTWHHADSVLIEAIKEEGARFEGMDIEVTSNMPDFAGTLTHNEIEAVLAYIKSTWPDDIRAMQWQQTVQSEAQ